MRSQRMPAGRGENKGRAAVFAPGASSALSQSESPRGGGRAGRGASCGWKSVLQQSKAPRADKDALGRQMRWLAQSCSRWRLDTQVSRSLLTEAFRCRGARVRAVGPDTALPIVPSQTCTV